jgi:hypothetical protein
LLLTALLKHLSQIISEKRAAKRGLRDGSEERTRPRVQFPASRRKTLFGETPNTTREDAYAPRTLQRFPTFPMRIALNHERVPR